LDNSIMLTLVLLVATLAPSPVAADKPSIAGAWTMNKDLSDAPRGRGDQAGGDRGDREGRRGGYGGGRGGYGGGRGGFGGGMGRGGGMRGERMTPDEIARMRDAMRALTDPSDHLTITETDSIIVITGADGHTTRLSPDGKKIKDENTGIERKTKWDGAKLVSEIGGLGSGKATQTFAVDPETHQLRIIVQMEGRGGSNQPPRTITHVYDADAR
jgi:hypothetical protein